MLCKELLDVATYIANIAQGLKGNMLKNKFILAIES
jgi:hypothetical protein